KVNGKEAFRQNLNGARPAVSEFRITGKVTGENGEELPGVNILLKGTTTGTTTEVDGTYSLTMPDGNGVLIFSFVGYNPQEIVVNNRSQLDIQLTPDTR